MLRLHPLSRSPSWRLGRPLLCKYAICGLWALNANLHENACVKFCVRDVFDPAALRRAYIPRANTAHDARTTQGVR
jgi:hypothetical protein